MRSAWRDGVRAAEDHGTCRLCGDGGVTIAKHHIDTNHHVNNAQYVEIAREVLPAEIEVGELGWSVRRRTVCGDVVYPHVSRTDEGYGFSLVMSRERLMQ